MRYLKDQGLVGERESVWELIKRVEIPWEWHADLAAHASKAGIAFFSTPFQEEAVDLLEGLGVPAFKIASYEVNHLPLIERAARSGKPLLISTGMASSATSSAPSNRCRCRCPRPPIDALCGELPASIR